MGDWDVADLHNIVEVGIAVLVDALCTGHDEHLVAGDHVCGEDVGKSAEHVAGDGAQVGLVKDF